MKHQAKRKVLKELENIPIISVAAKAAGVSRQTVYRWLEEDGEFRDAFHKSKRFGTNHINDMSESQVVSLIQQQKWVAVKYWLKNHHPNYKEPPEIKPSRNSEEMTAEEVETMNNMLAKFTKRKNGKS